MSRALAALAVLCALASCKADAPCEDVVLLEPFVNQNGQLTQTTSDQPAGFERCRGAVVRREVVACIEPSPPTACTFADGQCANDDDCGDGGVCFARADQECRCQFPCLADDDCGVDEACVCAMGIPIDADGFTGVNGRSECTPAACRTSADCGDGACVISVDICGTPVGLFCQTPDDACSGDDDCPSGYCAFDEAASRWGCTERAACE